METWLRNVHGQVDQEEGTALPSSVEGLFEMLKKQSDSQLQQGTRLLRVNNFFFIDFKMRTADPC